MDSYFKNLQQFWYVSIQLIVFRLNNVVIMLLSKRFLVIISLLRTIC